MKFNGKDFYTAPYIKYTYMNIRFPVPNTKSLGQKCTVLCGDLVIYFYTLRNYAELSLYLLIIKFQVHTVR